MAEGKNAKYSEPVIITPQSVSIFLEMLAKKGLKDQFLAGAPDANTALAEGQSDSIIRSAKAFSSKSGVQPDVLAKSIESLASRRSSVPTELWQASLSVEPNLMEYARTFVVAHKLAADFKIAKSLQAGRCGNGKECPPGV